MRRYKTEEDFWRIREFLREVFRANNRRELSWQTYRFDYWRWHGVENQGHGKLGTDLFIWEKPDGEIGAVLNPEGSGSVFLQVHPAYRTPQLEEEMLAVAEENLFKVTPDGRKRIKVWVLEHDHLRKDMVSRRNYVESAHADYQRRRDMSVPIPDVLVAEGYTVRSLGGAEELPARSLISWQAFHPDESDDAYQGWRWYYNIQRCPLYRRDLDLVAVAPEGKLAGFCTIWFDDVNFTGAFEPVGTAPKHQRRDLAKALMTEGLRRLKRLGAMLAFVGSWNEATHSLYSSVGFTEYDLLKAWVKDL
jgi:ribosomal protein S18 acetylase RimI-like enzyme